SGGAGAAGGGGAGGGGLLGGWKAERRAVPPAPAGGGRRAGGAPAPPKDVDTRRLDRSAALFLAAADEAWRDAGLPSDAVDLERCGLIEGSCLGPLADVLTAVRARAAANETGFGANGVLRFLTGAGGVAFAQGHRLRGPVLHLSAASVSSTCAIGEALQKLASGFWDIAVAGGAECPLQQDVVDSFRAAGILSAPRNGDPVCCPFDA